MRRTMIDSMMIDIILYSFFKKMYLLIKSTCIETLEIEISLFHHIEQRNRFFYARNKLREFHRNFIMMHCLTLIIIVTIIHRIVQSIHPNC